MQENYKKNNSSNLLLTSAKTVCLPKNKKILRHPKALESIALSGMDITVPTEVPDKAIKHNLLLSNGGAHFAHIAYRLGHVTP